MQSLRNLSELLTSTKGEGRGMVSLQITLISAPVSVWQFVPTIFVLVQWVEFFKTSVITSMGQAKELIMWDKPKSC